MVTPNGSDSQTVAQPNKVNTCNHHKRPTRHLEILHIHMSNPKPNLRPTKTVFSLI